jgi:hypothetical protein
MIRPSSSLARPFEQLATSNGALVKLLQAERDATPVLLTDWTHELSDAIYSQYSKLVHSRSVWIVSWRMAMERSNAFPSPYYRLA